MVILAEFFVLRGMTGSLFGSEHAAGGRFVFGDSSDRTMDYEADKGVFNSLGRGSDEGIIDWTRVN